MNYFTKILFPYSPASREQISKSLLILSLRILIGLLLFKHGLDKWENFDLLKDSFYDPLNITSRSSLILAIFGELFCAVGFIIGFLFRLSILPMITTMGVAYFMVHSGDTFSIKELSFIYLVLLIILLFSGPGSFSIDSYIGKQLYKKRSKSSSRLRNPMK